MWIKLARAPAPPLICPESQGGELLPSQCGWQTEPVHPQEARAFRSDWKPSFATPDRCCPGGFRTAGPRHEHVRCPACIVAAENHRTGCSSAAHPLPMFAIVPQRVTDMIALTFTAAAGLSRLRFGLGTLALGQVLPAFAHAFRRIPLYLQAVIGRQMEWVRSERDER